ncbi:MAG: hypothetical protein IJ193_07035 [Bacilli bacterium]|nr:hypothetical protein [Bacilli bacterium]
MNLTINPGAATEDAAQIDSIVETMESCMETLDAAIKRNIPDGIETTWSDEVKNTWCTYYGSDVPEAMAEMKQSATNLRMAVEAALKYSGE